MKLDDENALNNSPSSNYRLQNVARSIKGRRKLKNGKQEESYRLSCILKYIYNSNAILDLHIPLSPSSIPVFLGHCTSLAIMLCVLNFFPFQR